MRFAVIAHEPDDYEAWLAHQQEPAAPAGGDTAQGEEIVGQQCLGCHTIAGHPAQADTAARVGPDLTHVAQRARFAGYILDLNPENLAAWLADPQDVKPGAQMPDLGLDDAQIQAVIAYLETLD
jgi:cytochrome c oxidase subunit 2